MKNTAVISTVSLHYVGEDVKIYIKNLTVIRKTPFVVSLFFFVT